jgi:glycosyltransferase involved in cell wall biosynthesis
MGLTAGNDLRPGAVLSRSSRNGQSTPAALQSRRAQTLPYPTTPAFVEPNLKPVSVVIPTYNRAGLLEKTLRSCIEHSGGVDIELLVIDDGSTDDTADVLARLGSEIPNLAWRSIPNGGPGKARNLGASIAKHPVILFLGDDIQPLDSNFFVVHARLHALNPSDRFAVLGKAVWPTADVADVNFVMKHIQGRGGEQFGYADLTPHTYLDWKFFYTSNVSVKRTVVGDWITDGFQAEFKLAAFEDIELAYRLCKQPGSFRIYYDPTSLGRHIHPYTLNGFLNRQMGSGMMAKVFIDLHPEAIGPLGLKPLVQVLSSTSSQTQEKSTADYLSIIEGIRAWARMLESNNGLGREWWHEDLLFAVFEATYLQGFLLMQAENSSNFAGGYNYILTRCLQRLRKTIHHELTSHEFLKARLGFALAD